jgi:methylamine--corrinoid protein Co-methyltransferase
MEMVDFLEICKRAQTGAIMTEKDFNMNVFVSELGHVIQRYDIHYDPNTPVPSDDELADRVFQAAIEFFSEVGVYCQDTNRVVRFSQDEIEEGIGEPPPPCRVGEGKEAKIFSPRRPEDGSLPWCHIGSGIVASTEEIMTNLVEAYGSIPKADSISISALDSVRGIPAPAGSPLEIYAAIRSVRLGREALRRCGRPGLPIMNLISSAASAVGTIAASNPSFGLRPTDGWLVGALSEMKIDFGGLNKIAYLLNWGANIGSESSPILGGYCGGPEGTAVVNTAYIIMGKLALRGNYQLTFPVHFTYGCSSTRDVLWAVSTSSQAISRNIHYPVLSLGYMAAGPATKMYFYETAAYLLSAVSSGVSIQMTHPAKAVVVDGVTPMEAMFNVEMAHAAARINRADANRIVSALLGKYEGNIDKAPRGKTYQECFDMKTHKPNPDYIALVEEVKGELRGMGVF